MEEKHRAMREEAQQEKEDEKKLLVTVSLLLECRQKNAQTVHFRILARDRLLASDKLPNIRSFWKEVVD